MPTIIKVPKGGGGMAFTPITENQYGTHPAFNTQTELDEWLLINKLVIREGSTY